MPRLDTTEFWTLFERGELAFFAGSGICYDSGQPSAEAVLRRTMTAALPEIADDERDALLAIQPEVFYETLLGHVPREVALRPWLSLHPAVAAAHGVPPAPNIVHLELVRYSARTGIPIFTTNFDTLFEAAARQLGLAPRVMLPDDPCPSPRNVPTICKLHGSIGDREQQPDLGTLYTTMTAITRVNVPWIDALVATMRHAHLCFLGYSGKDIDLFPFLQRATRRSDTRPVIWVTRDFATDPCREQAVRAQALQLEGAFPGDVFAQRFDVAQDRAPSRPDGPSKALAVLAAETEERMQLDANARETLRAQLHGRRGAYALAYDLSQGCLARTHRPGAHAWLLHARLAHEQALYRTSARCALRAVLARRTPGASRRVDTVAMAAIVYAESCRMRIPFDTYFDPGPAVRIVQASPPLMAFVAVSILVAGLRVLSPCGLSIEAEHEWIEHRIRLVALVQSGLLATGLGRVARVRRALHAVWMSLKSTSYASGYAAGIANCHKFADRLEPGQVSDLATNIYTLTTSSTGQELLLRNRANACLDEGRFSEAEQAFGAMRDLARRSGNRLNRIKALLGIARARSARGAVPSVAPEDAQELQTLIEALEPGLLRRHLRRTLQRIQVATPPG